MPTVVPAKSKVIPQAIAMAFVLAAVTAPVLTAVSVLDNIADETPYEAAVSWLAPFGSVIFMLGTQRLFACSLKIVVKNGTNTTP